MPSAHGSDCTAPCGCRRMEWMVSNGEHPAKPGDAYFIRMNGATAATRRGSSGQHLKGDSGQNDGMTERQTVCCQSLLSFRRHAFAEYDTSCFMSAERMVAHAARSLPLDVAE